MGQGPAEKVLPLTYSPEAPDGPAWPNSLSSKLCPCSPVSNSLAAPLVSNPGLGLWILSWHLSRPALGF